MKAIQSLRRLRDYVRWFGPTDGVRAFIYEGVEAAPKLMVLRVKGVHHPLALRLRSSDMPTLRKVLIECEYELPVHSVPKTIVDAGANVGFSAVYFANRFPDAKIVAIEPERSNFEILKQNVAPFGNVTCLRRALVGTPRTVPIVDAGDGFWAFRAAAPDDTAPRSVVDEVEGITVLDVMRQFGWDRIDLLKVDIEGSEVEVFDTARTWIDDVEIVDVELHDRFRRGCSLAFYGATAGFRQEFHKGENVFLVR
jgi:FkbM family methyltransferase